MPKIEMTYYPIFSDGSRGHKQVAYIDAEEGKTAWVAAHESLARLDAEDRARGTVTRSELVAARFV